MKSRLHRPNLIAFGTESLLGVGAYAGVNQHGLLVVVEQAGADVVVVVALVVMPALGGKQPPATPVDADLCIGIPCVGLLR